MVRTTKLNYAALWQQCLEIIKGSYKQGKDTDRWFKVWYGDVKFDSYDADKHQLRLSVPSKYVYEYLEMHQIKLLGKALQTTFKEPVTLVYRIAPSAPSFADMAAYLQRQSGGVGQGKIHIHIDNARERLEDGLKYYLKDKPVTWLPGYEHIVRWLTDNDNRGLLCFGYSGVGKTLICQKILPILIGRPVVCVKANELHKRLEELKQQRILVIDGLGNEPRKHYGNTDQSFYELCDNAEHTGNILIITTNLSTNTVDDPHYPDSIKNRYGEEVFTRLKAITHTARIEAESLRE